MSRSGLFFFRRLRASDIHKSIDLHGIGGYDLPVQFPCDLYGVFCLSYRGGTDDDRDDSILHFIKPFAFVKVCFLKVFLQFSEYFGIAFVSLTRRRQIPFSVYEKRSLLRRQKRIPKSSLDMWKDLNVFSV